MANNKVMLGDGTTLMDITDTTAIAEDVAEGKVFYGADGVQKTGTMPKPTIRDCYNLFFNSSRLENIPDLLTFCKDVTRTNRMFYVTTLENTNDINNWLSTLDNSNNTDMGEMFSTNTRLAGTLDMSRLSFSSCNNMNEMFRYCNSLQTIKIGNSSTRFKDTVTTNQLFISCGALENLIIGGVNVLRATSYDFMSRVPETCKIYVPNSLVNSYKISTNWSERASYIFPISEYTGD